MDIIISIFKSLFYTFFPRKCLFCDSILAENETKICSRCQKLYPYPDSYAKEEFFAPLLPYISDICVMGWYSQTKKAIKEFKFNENLNYGRQLARLLNEKLAKQEWINDIDYIIPVPWHKRKLRKRGFNQSEYISKLIAKRFDKKIMVDNLVRLVYNKDQHGSSQEERYENVRGIFNVKNHSLLENKTVLLVDDVITTCSTVSECCKELVKSENIKIYIACLATDRQII